MCHSLSQGVAALFGPNSPYTAHHVQSICDSKEIPHIETRYDMTLIAQRAAKLLLALCVSLTIKGCVRVCVCVCVSVCHVM